MKIVSNSKRKIELLKKDYFWKTLSKITGNILELGFGIGENFKHYNDDCNVTAIDKNNIKFENQKGATIIIKNISDSLPFDNSLFDYIVFTFFLCTIREKEKIITELQRVLKPNGKIIYIEHITSNNNFYYLTQKISSPFTIKFFKGCSLNNNIEPFLQKKFKPITKKQIDNHIEPYEYAVWEKIS